MILLTIYYLLTYIKRNEKVFPWSWFWSGWRTAKPLRHVTKVISMAYCKTTVTLLQLHSSHCRLALSHRYILCLWLALCLTICRRLMLSIFCFPMEPAGLEFNYESWWKIAWVNFCTWYVFSRRRWRTIYRIFWIRFRRLHWSRIQNGRHFADNITKRIFVNDSYSIFIKSLLHYVLL